MASIVRILVTFLISAATFVHCHVCPPGWLDWPEGTSCYKITTSHTIKSWIDARSSCKAYQADLMASNSAAEQLWLESQLHLISSADPDSRTWWVGATNLQENVWTWIDDTPVSTQNNKWRDGQPDNKAGNEHCVYMTNTGSADDDCARSRPYVCERSKAVSLNCDIDNGWENYHGYCYRFYENRLSWDNAHDMCDSAGGRLVTILIDSIERFVADVVKTNRKNAWIGLRSVSDEMGPAWRWTYSNLKLTGSGYWADTASSKIQKGSENSSCVEVVLGTTGLNHWSNAACSARKSFICEKPEGVCAEGWIQYQTKCYEVQTSLPLTWPQALAHCTQHGQNGSLVEITSQLEQTFVNRMFSYLKEGGVRQLWIGVSDKASGGIGYASGADIGSFNNWDKPPTDTPKKLDCGQIFTDDTKGKWSLTTNCLQLRPFICQLPTDVPVKAVTTATPEMSCEAGWNLYDDQCFLFNDTSLDWMDARAACQGHNGDLATVPDNYTQAFINGHISSGVMWCGLNDRGKERQFTWLDGTTPTFINWYPNSPHKNGYSNCVGMVSTAGHIGQWNDVACTTKYGFICQKGAMMNGVTPAPASLPTTQDSLPITINFKETTISGNASWSARCGVNWEENAQLGLCYSFQDSPLAWLDAGQWCAQSGGTLASITSIHEQYFIAGRIRSMSSYAVWIGANDRDEHGGWEWTDGSPFAYLNWKSGEPNNPASENCVNIYVSSGLWNNNRCDARNGFVCKKSNGIGSPTSRTPATTVRAGVSMGCPPGWKAYKNKCYLFKSQRADQKTALLQCRQLGADLASVADVNEHNFISSQLQGYGEYWIGLNDEAIDWTYRWTDGSPVTFTHWSKSEPNDFEGKGEDCVSMYCYGRHGWNDQLCNFRAQGFICKSGQKPFTRTTPVPGCPPSAYLYEGMCYVYINDRKLWQDAEKKCVSLGGHLATISNRYQQAYLSSELSGKSGLFWIGLKKDSTGPYTWASLKNVTYTFWSKSHTGKEKNTCVAMVTEKLVGVWQNVPCSQRNNFICEVREGGYTTPIPTTPPSTPSTLRPISCPPGWDEHSGYCYKAFYSFHNNKKLTWSEALANCQGYGADLVSYSQKSEEDFIRDRVVRVFWRGDFWIGLSSTEKQEGYHWSDDTPFGYNNWATGEPDNRNNMENCVSYSSSSRGWFDMNCFLANNWICKLKKGVVPPTTMVPPTAITSPSCVSPDASWKYFHGMCYFVSMGNKKTWYEAQDWCHQRGAYLVSIHNKGENDVLTGQTNKLSYGLYWIGLNSLDLSGYKWSDSTGVPFVNWDKSEPNDANGGKRCITFHNSNGMWIAHNCNDKNEFICGKVNGSYSALPTVMTTVRPGNCPTGFHGFKSKCFFLGGNTQSSLLSWTAARDKCRSYGKGYDLASITEEEQAFVTTLLVGWNASLWIGLNDYDNENTFVWQDNSPTRYFNWAKGEPSGKTWGGPGQEDCVHMYSADYHAGQWNDENCDLLHGYICQVFKDPSYPKPTPVPLPSWCKAGYKVFGNNCYKLMPDPSSWFRAKAACIQDGSQLASITDVYEESAIRMMTSSIGQPVWIGLHDAEISGTYGWIDTWPVLYANWAEGEPSKDIGEGCVSFLPDGRWNDTKCNQHFLPVCKLSSIKPPPVTTPYPGHCADKSWDLWGDSCYYLQASASKSWPEARFECERKGMTLASIHSRAEEDHVFNLISKEKGFFGNRNVWLGLLKGVHSGFQWTDNSYVDFVIWEEGEPSDVNGTYHEDCVELKANTGHWNDVPCDVKKGFVCKTPAIMPTTTTGRPRQTPAATRTPSPKTSKTSKTSQTFPDITWGPARTGPVSDHSKQWTGSPLPQQGPNGLSSGSIVGICVGVLLVLALAAAVLIVLKRRKRFVYKTGRPSASFDNVLYPRSTEGVTIQEDHGHTNNAYLQSSST